MGKGTEGPASPIHFRVETSALKNSVLSMEVTIAAFLGAGSYRLQSTKVRPYITVLVISMDTLKFSVTTEKGSASANDAASANKDILFSFSAYFVQYLWIIGRADLPGTDRNTCSISFWVRCACCIWMSHFGRTRPYAEQACGLQYEHFEKTGAECA